MNILLIEDNESFSEHLMKTLVKNTYVNRVQNIKSLSEFDKLVWHMQAFDIVLVDLLLEWDTVTSQSGFKIIDTLRKNGSNIPIIVISSSDTIDNIEYAFSLWATDYMGKDIRYKELEVRLFHWYREYCMWSLSDKRWALSYHDLVFSTLKNEYLYKWEVIQFTKTMKYIFSIFFNEREELLPDGYLIEKIWWYSDWADMKNTLRVNIRRLRHILGKYKIDHWIITNWWEWYMFAYSEPWKIKED